MANTYTQRDAALERINRSMPPPEVPKKKASWFMIVMSVFAVLILLGLLIGLLRTASAPQPAIDAPETRPATETTPASPSELQR